MTTRTVALSPGKANKKFIMLAVALGLLGAILVYVAFSRGSSSTSTANAGNAPVVVAKADIPARTKVTQAMLQVKLVPADTRSELAFADPNAVIGKITRFPLSANEQVLSSKIVGLTTGANAGSRSLSYTIPAGNRGFAIGVSEVQSAGGLILPGDYVDVLGLFGVEAKNGNSTDTKDNYLVQTLFQNVEVLAVSQAVVDVVPEATPSGDGQRVRNSESKPIPGASTVTLSLTPEQAQRMYLAEANSKIRLSVRPYGEGTERPVDYMTATELYPQSLPNPFAR